MLIPHSLNSLRCLLQSPLKEREYFSVPPTGVPQVNTPFGDDCPDDRMAVGRTELPNGPIYVPEDPQETMPAPKRGSFSSILEGSLNPVPVSYLDQVVLKDLIGRRQRSYRSGSQKNIQVLFGHYYEW